MVEGEVLGQLEANATGEEEHATSSAKAKSCGNEETLECFDNECFGQTVAKALVNNEEPVPGLPAALLRLLAVVRRRFEDFADDAALGAADGRCGGESHGEFAFAESRDVAQLRVRHNAELRQTHAQRNGKRGRKGKLNTLSMSRRKRPTADVPRRRPSCRRLMSSVRDRVPAARRALRRFVRGRSGQPTSPSAWATRTEQNDESETQKNRHRSIGCAASSPKKRRNAYGGVLVHIDVRRREQKIDDGLVTVAACVVERTAALLKNTNTANELRRGIDTNTPRDALTTQKPEGHAPRAQPHKNIRRS